MTDTSNLDIPLERDIFLRNLIRELAGKLEEIIGEEEASGYISLVGQHIGDWINQEYKGALNIAELSHEQVAEVLVDLKRRIQGNFSVTDLTPQKIVLNNTVCPFGDKVLNRPSMCMMTSNVFGVITAENLGYAKVELQKTIANGDGHCCVVVHLNDDPDARACKGREYFKALD